MSKLYSALWRMGITLRQILGSTRLVDRRNLCAVRQRTALTSCFINHDRTSAPGTPKVLGGLELPTPVQSKDALMKRFLRILFTASLLCAGLAYVANVPIAKAVNPCCEHP